MLRITCDYTGFREHEIHNAIQFPDYTERRESKTIVHKVFPKRFSGYPLKVVYEEGDEAFIITAYPLKKAYRR